MFVGAEAFQASVCAGVFTHYKREEDATMEGGKLDEELSRMSAIAEPDRSGHRCWCVTSPSRPPTSGRGPKSLAR